VLQMGAWAVSDPEGLSLAAGGLASTTKPSLQLVFLGVVPCIHATVALVCVSFGK